MQKELEAIEKELETREYAATVNQGDVNVVCNGAMQIQSLTIKEELIQEGDKEKYKTLLQQQSMRYCERQSAIKTK